MRCGAVRCVVAAVLLCTRTDARTPRTPDHARRSRTNTTHARKHTCWDRRQPGVRTRIMYAHVPTLSHMHPHAPTCTMHCPHMHHACTHMSVRTQAHKRACSKNNPIKCVEELTTLRSTSHPPHKQIDFTNHTSNNVRKMTLQIIAVQLNIALSAITLKPSITLSPRLQGSSACNHLIDDSKSLCLIQ